jgi:hypothetical protein
LFSREAEPLAQGTDIDPFCGIDRSGGDACSCEFSDQGFDAFDGGQTRPILSISACAITIRLAAPILFGVASWMFCTMGKPGGRE